MPLAPWPISGREETRKVKNVGFREPVFLIQVWGANEAEATTFIDCQANFAGDLTDVEYGRDLLGPKNARW